MALTKAKNRMIADAAFNVKDYGATGDGSTNDKTAIQAAIDAANSAGGGLVFVPEGTYIIDNDIEVKSNVIMQGTGVGSLIKGDGTASPFEFKIIGDNSGLRDIKVLGTSDVDDSKGIKRVYIVDSAETGAVGAGPTNVFVDNVVVEKTSFNGIAIYGSTDVTVTNCTIKQCKSHGIPCVGTVNVFVSNARISQTTTGSLGGGNYAFDISTDNDQTVFENILIDNCEAGFKINNTTNENTSVKTVKILGGANSNYTPVFCRGIKSYISDIYIDSHPQSTAAGQNEVFRIETGSSMIIDGVKIKGVNDSGIEGIQIYSSASNIQMKNLAVDAVLSTALQIRGNKVRIDGFYEQQAAAESIRVLSDGTNAVEDLFIANCYLSDDIIIDDNGATTAIKRAHFENIVIDGAGIQINKAVDSTFQNIRATNTGARPFQLKNGATNVKIVGCVSDNVDQTFECFRVDGATQVRTTFINCTAMNGSTGFLSNQTNTDVLLIGSTTDNCTADLSGFTSGVTATGNTF